MTSNLQTELDCAEEVLDGLAVGLNLPRTDFDCIGSYIRAVAGAISSRHAAELRPLHAEVERLNAEVHNLNWALGTTGYEQMYAPEEQLQADAAALENIERMKARKARHEALLPDGADYLDEIDRLRARVAELEATAAGLLCIHDEPAGFAGKYGKDLDRAIQTQQNKVDAAVTLARAALAARP